MRDDPPDTPPPTWSSRAAMMSERTERVAELERAVNSGRRLLAGLGAFVPGFGGAALTGASLDYIDTYGADAGATAGLVIGIPALIAGLVLGAWVWRAGRGVNTALIAWEELPDHVARDGSRVDPQAREATDAETLTELAELRRKQWVTNRARLFTLARVGRVALGALACFGAVVLLLYVTAGGRMDEYAATGLGSAVALAFTGVVVFGGQLRFGACLTRRDWRLRHSSRARFGELDGLAGH